MRLSLSYLIVPLGLLACLFLGHLGYVTGHGVADGNRVPMDELRRVRDLRISYSRSGCLGPCPIYTLQIDGDGRTRLSTIGHLKDEVPPKAVDLLHVWQLSPERHRALVDILETGDFRALKLDYTLPITDHETRTISISNRFGVWSTSVYEVPCVGRIDAKYEFVASLSAVPAPVPNVFCKVEDQLRDIVCDTLLHGVREGWARPAQADRPPHCDEAATRPR